MGRGDKRTKKGKISIGSFGKSRLARATKKVAAKTEKKADGKKMVSKKKVTKSSSAKSTKKAASKPAAKDTKMPPKAQ